MYMNISVYECKRSMMKDTFKLVTGRILLKKGPPNMGATWLVELAKEKGSRKKTPTNFATKI